MKNHLTNSFILISPLFLVALLSLLVNDFYLKEAFHNGFTGKMSDFAGLFIFPIFFSSLLGRKKIVFFFTLILFVFWKSTASEFAIDYWNSLHIFPVARVVDYTDCVALLILPLSYYYNPGNTIGKTATLTNFRYVILAIAGFSFLATAGTTGRITSYEVDASKKQLFNVIKALQTANPDSKVPILFYTAPTEVTYLDRNGQVTRRNKK